MNDTFEKILTANGCFFAATPNMLEWAKNNKKIKPLTEIAVMPDSCSWKYMYIPVEMKYEELPRILINYILKDLSPKS